MCRGRAPQRTVAPDVPDTPNATPDGARDERFDLAVSLNHGRPVYLAMTMVREQRLRLKPQNLLLNLPLARPQ